MRPQDAQMQLGMSKVQLHPLLMHEIAEDPIANRRRLLLQSFVCPNEPRQLLFESGKRSIA